VGLVFVLLQFGIPLLIRMAIFLSERGGSALTGESEEQLILSAPSLDAPPEATSETSLRLTGYGPPDTTLSVIINGKVTNETLLSEDGAFDLRVELREGQNTISAKATDNRGNESPRSTSWKVVRDTEPPELVVEFPEDNASFRGEGEKTVEVAGTTDDDASVIVNGRVVILSGDGNFSTRLELSEGENGITVSSVDRAGNETSQELTVNWQP
jgi:bacillopeptidase F